jgi:hypothetical protein
MIKNILITVLFGLIIFYHISDRKILTDKNNRFYDLIVEIQNENIELRECVSKLSY